MNIQEHNDQDSSLPVCIKEINISKLYGLVKFQVTVEDRRPDILENEKKFKTQIKVKLFFYNFSFIIRSKNPPTIIINNTEDNYDLIYVLKKATSVKRQFNNNYD